MKSNEEKFPSCIYPTVPSWSPRKHHKTSGLPIFFKGIKSEPYKEMSYSEKVVLKYRFLTKTIYFKSSFKRQEANLSVNY